MSATAQLAAATRMATVHLTVRELEPTARFYERVLGLRAREADGGVSLHAAVAAEPLVRLHADPAAASLDRRRPGLFHLALLLPGRRELALALARVVQARWPLDGASDHLVSEALYLSDPEGNGIELYRDRPREDWPRQQGELQMATVPLDLDDLLGELKPGSQLEPEAPAGTVMGHVHLQVSDLAEAEAFYHGVLGFDVMVRLYPRALFVSAGGYHHHLGLNTWHSRGAAPPPPGAAGLRFYEIALADPAELAAAGSRLRAAGVAVEAVAEGLRLHDPAGNGILLRA